MKKEHKLLLDILAQFMHPEKNCTKLKPLNTFEEWQSLYNLSVMHHAEPIVYDGLEKNGLLEFLPDEIKTQWRKQAIGKMIFQAQNTQSFLDVYKELRNSGVDVLVVKGIICRNLYSKPDYRMSSDEDLYITLKDFDICNSFFVERGFKRADVDEKELPYEISYFNSNNGLNIELHTSFFDGKSASYGHWNKEFDGIFENKKEIEINGEKILTLNDTDHLFFLICHAMKHFLHGGFGIRQLCDIVRLSEEYGDLIDWQTLISKTKNLNMYVFWMNLLDIARTYLGFDWENCKCPLPEDETVVDSDDLLDDILCSGIYGKSSSGRMHSANITLGAVGNKKNLFASVFYSLFPSRKYLEKRYPYLKRWSILLPVAWVQRLIGYRKERKNERMEFASEDSITVGRQRVQLLKKYRIIK